MNEKNRTQILGENLAKIRKEKGISRKQLAEGIGVTVVSIGSYETGTKQPPLEKIFALANFLKVSVSDLIGEVNKGKESRLRHAMNLAVLADFHPLQLDDGSFLLEVSGKSKKISDTTFSQWLKEIKFDNADEFITAIETAEKNSIRHETIFKYAFENLMGLNDL